MREKKDWTGNKKSTFVTLGASNHTDHSRAWLDFYATSPTAITRFLEKHQIPRMPIWECVDDQTEYFNGEEWKSISEYQENELVLIYDKSTGVATLEKPFKYIKEEFLGDFHLYEGQRINMFLTDEHRILYEHRRKKGVFLVKTAKEVFQEYQQDSNGFRGKIPTTFTTLETQNDISIPFLRLAIACQADGYRMKKNTYQISIKKDRKKKRLEEILTSANILYKKYEYGDFSRYKFNSPLGCKTFPFEWLFLSKKAKWAIINEIGYWDGYKSSKTCIKYFSTNKHNIDVIQLIAHSLGLRTTITKDERVRLLPGGYKSKKDNYTLIISKTTTSHALSKKAKEDNYAKKPSNGFKYCFNVRTGFLVLRRKDKIFITGNCAAGENSLTKPLREAGYNVITSDIVKRRATIDYVEDFLSTTELRAPIILTNPPYSEAANFVLHSIELGAEYIYMFLKTTFLEGQKRYEQLFSQYPPKEIWVFSRREQCAINNDEREFQKSSAACYAWFIWEKGFRGDPTIHWI